MRRTAAFDFFSLFLLDHWFLRLLASRLYLPTARYPSVCSVSIANAHMYSSSFLLVSAIIRHIPWYPCFSTFGKEVLSHLASVGGERKGRKKFCALRAESTTARLYAHMKDEDHLLTRPGWNLLKNKRRYGNNYAKDCLLAQQYGLGESGGLFLV
jgi:hypothetical protein